MKHTTRYDMCECARVCACEHLLFFRCIFYAVVFHKYMYHRYKWRDFVASRDRKVKIVYKIIDTWSFRQRQIEHCQRARTHTAKRTFMVCRCTHAHHFIRQQQKYVNIKPNHTRTNVERRNIYSNRMCLFGCCCCCCWWWFFRVRCEQTAVQIHSIQIRIKCKYFCQ